MTTPAWVNSRIQFDLAAAIMAANGKLHIDDALIIAATPCVLVDYANEPDSNLRYICRAMRKFFSNNPRYVQFTKAAVAEGLRREWLPELEVEEKAQMLSDFQMVPSVDADGYVIFNSERVANCTKKEHPDNEKYGDGAYTVTDQRKPRTRLRKTEAPEIFFHSSDDDGYIYAPLKISADEWYAIIKDASSVVIEFLKCYIHIPDGQASCLEIERMFGIRWENINARNTALGRRAQSMLNIEVYEDRDMTKDDNRRYWSTPMLRGRKEHDGFRWQMRPELLEAAKRLAAEEKWQPLTRVDKYSNHAQGII